ncbi:RidA family protein [Pandoraea cepalis]|nr:RidA family protein [Pandoraea cepalis]
MFEAIDIGLPKSLNMVVTPAVRVADVLHTVQVPSDMTTGKIVEGSMAVQARQTFGNLRTTCERAGCTLADVFQIIIYITDRDDFAEMDAAYREFFTEAPYPNRATVVVQSLIGPMGIEVVAQAALR